MLYLIIGIIMLFASCLGGCGAIEDASQLASTSTATGTATATATGTGTGTETAATPAGSPVIVNVNVNQNQGNESEERPICYCDPSTHYCYSDVGGYQCPQQ